MKGKALVVDDDPSILRALELCLELEGLEVATAPDGERGLEVARAQRPDVIVLDVMMPKMSGLEVARRLREDPELAQVPVVLLTARAGHEDLREGWRAGVRSYLTKPFDLQELLAEVMKALARPQARGADRASVEGRAGAGRELEVEDEAVLLALLSAAMLVDARDPGTRQHLERVTGLGVAFAREVAPELLSDPGFVFGMLLHDVGKLALPSGIFSHPGPLGPREWMKVYEHPLHGVELVSEIPFLRPAIPVIRWHHERWNGQGYPDGLGGEAIPPAARLFTICDAFDSMISPRPYRPALSRDEARAEIRKDAGVRFDPTLVETFLALEPSLGLPQVELQPDGQLEVVLGRLTLRRWQVLALSAAGYEVEGLARLLGMSPHVVRNYRVSLRRRLELNPQRPFPGALRERLRPLLRGSAPGLAALLAGMGDAE